MKQKPWKKKKKGKLVLKARKAFHTHTKSTGSYKI